MILFCATIFLDCSNQQNEKHHSKDNKITLRRDTLNVVKITDQMVIYESTCRSCAFETSTRFEISDTLNIVRLGETITTDDNPPDMAGGSISKELLIVPIKAGITTIRVYKIWSAQTAANDSINYTSYNIDVRN